MPEDKPHHPAQATYDANRVASQQAFLAVFPTAGNIAQAAKAIGIHPQTVYMLWNKDEEFREQLAVARELYSDYLEELALQKIQTGDWHHDNMHMQQLNAARPEKYKPELRLQPGAVTPATIIVINLAPGVEMPAVTAPKIVDGRSREVEDA